MEAQEEEGSRSGIGEVETGGGVEDAGEVWNSQAKVLEYNWKQSEYEEIIKIKG